MLVPIRPERAHLCFVIIGRVCLAHSLRNIVPLRLAGIAKAALTLFERLDIIRRRKSSRAEKLEEIEESVFPGPFGLLLRSQRPGADIHEIGRRRIVGPHRHCHDVVDYQIRENKQVPIEGGDTVGNAVVVDAGNRGHEGIHCATGRPHGAWYSRTACPLPRSRAEPSNAT